VLQMVLLGSKSKRYVKMATYVTRCIQVEFNEEIGGISDNR
jgi:hypothetical protein